MPKRPESLENFSRCGGRLAGAILAVAGMGVAVAAHGQSFTEFKLSMTDSTPLGIAAGPDGALWFTELYANKIGRITTTGVLTEFPSRR